MEVSVDTCSIALPASAGDSLVTRISRIFGRLNNSVTRLHMTLADVNGPKGGRDKLCMLRLQLKGGGQVVVVDQAAKLSQAISRSLRRARRHMAARRLRQRILGRRQSKGALVVEVA